MAGTTPEPNSVPIVKSPIQRNRWSKKQEIWSIFDPFRELWRFWKWISPFFSYIFVHFPTITKHTDLGKVGCLLVESPPSPSILRGRISPWATTVDYLGPLPLGTGSARESLGDHCLACYLLPSACSATRYLLPLPSYRGPLGTYHPPALLPATCYRYPPTMVPLEPMDRTWPLFCVN